MTDMHTGIVNEIKSLIEERDVYKQVNENLVDRNKVLENELKTIKGEIDEVLKLLEGEKSEEEVREEDSGTP